MREYELDLELLVAGFDHNDIAHIFSLESAIDRGEPKRHDLGFYAIGSGSTNAEYVLKYRELSPKTHLREALYYSVEAKFYGEDSPSVGFRTDTFVWFIDSAGQLCETAIPETTIDKQLTKVFRALEPGDLEEKHFGILNGLDELIGIPTCPLPKEMQQRKEKREAKQQNRDGKAKGPQEKERRKRDE